MLIMTIASAFEILPAIDVQAGRVVRLRQGDFARETAYSDDPARVAQAFETAGARWIHVVDLDGARTGRPAQVEAVAAILAAVGKRLRDEVAGGLRTAGVVSETLAAGAFRAVLGTTALGDPDLAGDLVSTHGADRIAVAIDVRAGQAVGRGWSTSASGIEAVTAMEQLADVGVTTFEVTAIERDGLLEGPDLDLYDRFIQLDRGAVIASGGITTMEDLRNLRTLGCAGAIIGRALYEGRLDLAAVLTDIEPVGPGNQENR